LVFATFQVTINLDSRSRGPLMPMLRKLLPILCFAVFAAFHVTQAHAQTTGGKKFATEVPLLDCDGMPCIEAKIGTGPNLKMGWV